MILNTGSRTDIPAFYAEWFVRRLREGFVMARSPYDPQRITRYVLDPAVVDLIVFCTKNPAPLLAYRDALASFRQFWGVTITPYGKDVEPETPPVEAAIESLAALSRIVGRRAVHWRYDPVFITEKYTLDFHRRAFRRMAEKLSGTTENCVVSFVDLYKKTQRNFPSLREVSAEERLALGETFAAVGREFGIKVRTCLEGDDLAPFGIDTQGCMTQAVLEEAVGCRFHIPRTSAARKGCACLLGNDIGVYNTCAHFCRYCYANASVAAVRKNRTRHDPASPLLIGHAEPGDIVQDARQVSYVVKNEQLGLFE